MQLQSPAFKNGGMIPEKYTLKGKNVNPPFTISDIPAGTKCLVLIGEDPDNEKGLKVGWLVYDVPVADVVPENFHQGVPGTNSYQEQCYRGPCHTSGVHRYYFKCYALSKLLQLPEGADKEQVIKRMEDRLLASTEIMGRWQAC